MTDRVPCCVPFCRRTIARGDFNEWICPRHWPLVSAATKRRRRLADRIADRAQRRFDTLAAAQGGYWLPAQRRRVEGAIRRAAAAWERCKAEAIERAGGIG